MRLERVYRNSTRALSAVIVVLGGAMIATALAGGGGPLALGVILGTLLVLLGLGRLYLARGRRAP